jgi:hypothetical protein
MTNRSDVIRQIETVLNDTHYPPTREQKEILTSILRKVSEGTYPKVSGGTLRKVSTRTR